jgi:hypothetical protein
MTRFTLLFIFSILCVQSNAQTFEKAKPYYILKYDVTSNVTGFEIAIIKSPFASQRLSKKSLPRNFNKGKIVAIDYYYTQFRSAKSFQQIGLDEKRFSELKKLHPTIHKQIDSVPIRFIEQTLAKTIKEAKFFFHGFVVYYQVPMMSSSNSRTSHRSKEINLINKLFKNNFELDNSPKFGEIREIKGAHPSDLLHVWGNVIDLAKPDSVIEVEEGNIKAGVIKASENDFVTCYQEIGLQENNKMAIKLFRVPRKNYPGSSPSPFTEGMYGLIEKNYEDSKLRALSAQKQQFPNAVSGNLLKSLESFDSDSIVLVIDITGSMVESIAQVLKWLHKPEVMPKIKGIVLFNDGDGRKDRTKKIGKTGGIHFVDNIKTMQKKLVQAMGKGNGGDLIENDIEAVLAARNRYGNATYILVADNLAHPRDLPLLIDVDFPLNLLMCNAIETAIYYQNIPKKTGGVIINRK